MVYAKYGACFLIMAVFWGLSAVGGSTHKKYFKDLAKVLIKNNLVLYEVEFCADEQKDFFISDIIKKRFSPHYKKLCKKFKCGFEVIESALENNENKEKPPCVIIGIDATAFLPIVKDNILLSSGEKFRLFLTNPFIGDFYKWLINKKIKVFFLSARANQHTDSKEKDEVLNVTVKNLVDGGFTGVTNNDVICMPVELRTSMLKTMQENKENSSFDSDAFVVKSMDSWKQGKLAELAEKFNIVGMVDDDASMAKWKNVGSFVWVYPVFQLFNDACVEEIIK